jgi:hypothetical protein
LKKENPSRIKNRVLGIGILEDQGQDRIQKLGEWVTPRDIS